MQKMIAAILLVVGLINIIPMIGLVSAARLEGLYGISIAGNDLAILMRHRALLLGIIGCLLLVSMVLPPLRTAAIVAAFSSMLSFVVIAWTSGEYNGQLQRVIMADLAASALLLIGCGMIWWQART